MWRSSTTGASSAGAATNTLIVWAMGDDGAFAATQTLSGHTGFVMCMAQLNDGRLVDGSQDETLDPVSIVWTAGDDGMFAAAQRL